MAVLVHMGTAADAKVTLHGHRAPPVTLLACLLPHTASGASGGVCVGRCYGGYDRFTLRSHALRHVAGRRAGLCIARRTC